MNTSTWSRSRWTPRVLSSAARAAAATLGVALLPKCPLCIAAYLTSFGLGSAAAAVAAPLLRPFAWLLAGASFLALAGSAWRKLRVPRAAPEAQVQSAGGCCAALSPRRLVEPK
jgi:hypothetical protein